MLEEDDNHAFADVESPMEVQGILVKVVEGEGRVSVDLEMIGSFSPLAAPAALELAGMAARRYLGL